MTLYSCKKCGVVVSGTADLDIREQKSDGQAGPVITAYRLVGSECPGCGHENPHLAQLNR